MARKKTSAKSRTKTRKTSRRKIITPSKTKRTGSMMMVLSFLVLFAVNSVIIYFANLFFPQHVVLGTFTITPVAALLISMTALTLDNTFAIPFFHAWESNRKKELTSAEWMIGYFFINFIALWVIGRFAHFLGLGFSSWMIVLALAAVLDFFQGLAMMVLSKAAQS